MNGLRLASVRILKNLLSGVRFRGKQALLNAVCPRNRVLSMTLFGYTFSCDLSEHIQRSIFLYGYDDLAQSFVKKNLKEGDVFLDIGANVGFYSLLAASIVGEKGRVVAIEPYPKTFAALKATVERNGIKNILPLNIGLGKEKGYSNLFINPAFHNDSPTMVHHEASERVRVEIVSLDMVATTHHLENIDYLKIDVEGFEPNVFAGATTLLKEKRIKIIQCEFNDYWLRKNGSSPEVLHRLLIDFGYEDVEGAPNFIVNGLVDRMFIRR
jgi:FkbM family methyltransferase